MSEFARTCDWCGLHEKLKPYSYNYEKVLRRYLCGRHFACKDCLNIIEVAVMNLEFPRKDRDETRTMDR